MKKIFKAALALIKDGKILCTKEYGTDRFFMLGGTVENGETTMEALRREVREETGVEVDESSLKLLGAYEDRATLEPNTIIHIDLFKGDVVGKPKPSSDIESLEWFGAEDDWDRMGIIDKNKIMPDLVKRGMIK